MTYDGTIVEFISHSTVLIRYRDHVVLADPWLLTPAVSSWVPCPPPVIAREVWAPMAKTGKLAVLLSHQHGDHTDIPFLKTLPPETPVYIPGYERSGLIRAVAGAGLSATEIWDHSAAFGPFVFDRFVDRSTGTDAAISIRTPDSFIMHGNDAWQLSPENKDLVRSVKPTGAPSLLMGQGGSASGHPLTYRNFTDREGALVAKNRRMLNGLSDLAVSLGFDRVVPYACLTGIKVQGKDYSFKAPTPIADYANAVTGRTHFLDLSPGDVYLPAKDLLIPILRTLHCNPRDFETWPVEPIVSEPHTVDWYISNLSEFLSDFKWFAQFTSFGRRYSKEGLTLKFEVVIEPSRDLQHPVSDYVLLWDEMYRQKTCYIPDYVAAAVFERKIPFENLYTGYLAEWERHPVDHYNADFLNCLIEFGYEYMGAT